MGCVRIAKENTDDYVSSRTNYPPFDIVITIVIAAAVAIAFATAIDVSIATYVLPLVSSLLCCTVLSGAASTSAGAQSGNK